MHGMNPTSAEYRIVIEIGVNNFYFDLHCLSFQGDGKVR